MKVKLLVTLLLFAMTNAHAQPPPADQIPAVSGDIIVQPIRHGTLALSWNSLDIYVDPTGGAEAFAGLDSPDLILITHTHGDHLDTETLDALDTEGTVFVVPQAVADELPDAYSDQLVVIANGESTEQLDIPIRAIPMYNLPAGEDGFHPKGQGNGYVVTLGGKQVYLSGDTEGISEMRSLKGIEVAFVCMNLPYTMDVEQAADAVLDFEPVIVYPYHYRGQNTEKFKKLVTSENTDIEVRLRDWYAGN